MASRRKEVLTALAKVDRRPETSEPYRNTILLGLAPASRRRRARPCGCSNIGSANRQPYQADAPLAEQLAAWQTWYAKTFPNELPAELPKESQPNKWSYEELASYLESPEGKAGQPVARRAGVHRCSVHQVPSLQRPRRRHRPRSDHGGPALPAQGNSGVDRLSEPGRLRSVREPDRDRQRQDVHRHRRHAMPTAA